MPRLIKSPNSGSTIVNAISPEQGGHGEVTAVDALEAMDLVPRNSIGKFGRPIPLDNNGYIDQRYLQDLYATMETVSGDLTIEVNQSKEYFLTGYDAFSVYDVRAVSGTVSVDRNVITYTAPGEPGQGGFTINGRMVGVTVTEADAVEGIAPPVILTPLRGTTGLTGPVSVTSSAFVTDNSETHASTSWQCAEDPEFTAIVASVDQSTTHKTSWSIGTVMMGKHYFIRARYHGNGGGVSPWSEETHFTTPVPTPADRPSITSPLNGATRLPSRVTLTSSTYNTVTGDPHVSTSWEISESPLFTSLAFQNTDTTVDKTSWMVSGLQPAKEYYARVRYRGQLHEYTEWSLVTAFRTRLAFSPETEIAKSGTYNGVAADMDDSGDRWIVSTGNPDIDGDLCAAYIYRREGGVPVLEDTIQAVAGQKNIVATIPLGGWLEVTVNGRYNSTESYTQDEEIIIPEGAQTLTLVGRGNSSNEPESVHETTVTIDGQTYTFPGSDSGSATNTTFTVDLVSNNNFGNGVAMNQDGTLAAICSSPRVGTTAGYVLVLQRNGMTWNIVDELNRADGLVWNAQSVSMDKTGNYILVGADAQPVGASKIGSFAIYRRQAGKYVVEQTVIAPDPGVAYEAGSSVSLSGNAAIAVIGAPAGGVASRALVYERNDEGTFELKATLSKTTDPHSADSFGTRVYISADGTTVAASSPTSRGVNTAHANCGEVIIFRKIDNVWTQVSTVRHPTPTSGLYFGQDLHLSDDGFTLSVGVPGGTGGLGEVMFFDIEGSSTVYKSNVVSSAVTGGTNFGKAIALPGHSGDLVGASKFGTYVFD